MWSLPRQPAARQRDQGVQHVNPRIVPAALAALALASGVAACGSDDDTSSASTGSSAASTDSGSSNVTGTLNGAGSTFAAPIYQQVGADLKDNGRTIN
jgi:phosphate transport system substrate-binding protein